jgi:mono/diheme cytochrome c family protein
MAAIALLPAGCQQKMARQPHYRALESSEFFPDGRSARPLLDGVVTRDQPLDSSPLVSGLVKGRHRVPLANGETPLAGAPDDPANYVTEFPFQVTEADLRRGQQRFAIYCTPCHGPLGDGHGKIVERGYLQPPSYIADDSRGFFRWGRRLPLRKAPVGYLFEVASRGYGGMPDYAEQVPADDRWRIVAYIRTLQLSRYAVLRDLPPAERAEALRELGGAP